MALECVAQQTTTPSTTLSESLSEEVNDPTATLQEFFTPSEYGTNAQPNTLQVKILSLRFYPTDFCLLHRL